MVNKKIVGWTKRKGKSYRGFTNIECTSKTSKTDISLWRDWEGYWNVYISRYPFSKDTKLYRGKKYRLAVKKLNDYISTHKS